MAETQDQLRVPVCSLGEAGAWADVSAATLGVNSPVTAQFSEIAWSSPEALAGEPVVIELEGDEARAVHDGLVRQIREISFCPPPDEATERRYKSLRHLIFQADFQRASPKAA